MSDSEDDGLQQEEARLARSAARAALPAIYIDSWSTLTWTGHVRIALGENMPTGDVYRSAIVMTLSDAESFAQHLLGSIDRRREKDRLEMLEDQNSEDDTLDPGNG
jgi:hypothetical protein